VLSPLVLSRIPVLLLVVNININYSNTNTNKIYQPIKRQILLFRYTLVVQSLALPLPALAGYAVLVLYSSALAVTYDKGDQPHITVLLSWAY
jgi:hypothetical protein